MYWVAMYDVQWEWDDKLNPQSILLYVTYNGGYSFTIFLQIDMYCVEDKIDSY